MATPPITETIELPRKRGLSRRAVRRAGWITLDLAAVAGCAIYALQALT
jgi:hypothetical protein